MVFADLAHLPLSEAAPGLVTVPGLHAFDRPGTVSCHIVPVWESLSDGTRVDDSRINSEV